MGSAATTLALVSTVSAAWGWGFCPMWWQRPAPVGNFNKLGYTGNWYEIQRDKEVGYLQGKRCVTATYTYVEGGAMWWPFTSYELIVENRSMDEDGVVKDPKLFGTLNRSWARCDD